METFDTILRTAIKSLKTVETLATNGKTLSSTIVPVECYQHWKDIASNHSLLAESIPLLSIRNESFIVLQNITDSKSFSTPRNFNTGSIMFEDPLVFNGLSVPFATARYLTLSSYVASTWSLFDKLSVFCGQIIGPIGLADNPIARLHPKLVSLFIRAEKGAQPYRPNGFSLEAVLPLQWEFPAILCYKIRNLVLHDGIGKGGDHFFESDEHTKGFLLTESAKEILLEDYPNTADKLAAMHHSISDGRPGFPWFDSDLRTVLKQFHSEIDTMFERLISWGVSAFCEQFKVFSEPDKQWLSI